MTMDPMLGEAIAGLQATSLCAELGLSQMILEGDSLSVVKVIKHLDESWSFVDL